jgi:flagellin
MKINSNLSSLFVQRQLGNSSQGLSTSLQRLSSGLRINSAKDDAAGLAISERMTTQVRGFMQAQRNVNDGVSMLATAEGAMGNATGLLQRIRELAVQASNATNSNADKEALQAEVAQLIGNLDNLGEQAEFNGQKIFSQSTNSIGGDANQRALLDTLHNWVGASLERINTYYGLQGDGASINVNLFQGSSSGVLAYVQWTATDAQGKALNLSLNLDLADFLPLNPPNGGTAPYYNDRIVAHEMVHAVMGRTMNMSALPNWFKEGAAEFIHGADERVIGDTLNYTAGAGTVNAGIDAIQTAFSADDVSGSAGYSAGYLATRFIEKNAGGMKNLLARLAAGDSFDTAINTVSGGNYANQAALKTAIDTALQAVDTAAAGDNNAAAIAAFKTQFNVDLSNQDTGAVGNLDANSGPSRNQEAVIENTGAVSGFNVILPDLGGSPGSNEFVFQAGANVGETISVSIGAINASALGMKSASVVTAADAVISASDRALDYVNAQRARLGAQMSALESTSSRLSVAMETTSAARSRIRDADLAAETATLTRQQILQSAGIAMAAQANAIPQMALSLLR